MGTLFDQPPREFFSVQNDDVKSELEFVIELSKKYKVPPADIIALMGVLEQRRKTTSDICNQDVLDEQLAGFGEIISELSDNLKELLYKLTFSVE